MSQDITGALERLERLAAALEARAAGPVAVPTVSWLTPGASEDDDELIAAKGGEAFVRNDSDEEETITVTVQATEGPVMVSVAGASERDLDTVAEGYAKTFVVTLEKGEQLHLSRDARYRVD